MATAAPVSEPQWPALSTVSGEISVPVQPNAPKVISATEGNSPAPASLPPTMAEDGAAVKARAASATVDERTRRRRRFMAGPIPQTGTG